MGPLENDRHTHRPESEMKTLRSLRLAGAIPWLHARSLAQAVRDRRLFANIESYCQFIGYPRSGHTLVYALLNAHPEVVLSNELGALRFVRYGFSHSQLYSMILRSDQRFAREGFEFQGYVYRVPNQWQGRFSTIRVMGDKDGGRDTMRLCRSPELLERLGHVIKVPIRFVHVVRNPFDMIATFVNRRVQRGERTTLDEALKLARQAVDTVRQIAAGLPPDSLLTIRHEDMIRDPAQTLKRLCRHLNIGAGQDYLQDCARIVFPSSRLTRHSIEWTPRYVELVETEIVDRYDFLSGYSYDA